MRKIFGSRPPLGVPGFVSVEALPRRPAPRAEPLGRAPPAPGVVRMERLADPDRVYPRSLHALADLDGASADHFLHLPDYCTLPFRVGELQDVAVLRTSRALVAPGLGLVDEFTVGGGAYIPPELLEADGRGGDGAWSLPDREVERVPGLSIPFCHYGQAAFGHFVLDGLLQVQLHEAALEGGGAQVVEWPFDYPRLAEALTACGVIGRRLRKPRRRAALMERAAVSSGLAAHGVYYPGEYSKRFFDWLPRRVLGEAPAPPRAGRRRLYVRRTGYARGVRDADALEALALSHGFEPFTPQDHGFAEQVRAFAEAEAVLGAYGSALTLSPLLGGERTVIELLPASVTDPWFTRQAAVHGFRHLPILHPSTPEGDIVADLDRIGATLARLGM